MMFILEDIQTSDYYQLIMLDLPEILHHGTIHINNFFEYDEIDDDPGKEGDEDE